MSLNVLLMSDEMMKERSLIHGNTDPKLLHPSIKVAQDKYIFPILGSALYDKLQSAVNAGDWTGLDDYKTLLDKYIIDALMYYTLSRMPMDISYQFWNKGVVRKQGENTELPSMSELVDISNGYKNDAEFYGNRLKLHLRANASSKYPEYLNPGNDCETMNPEQNAFTMPIYLGGDDCGCDGFNNKPYG